MQLMTAVRASPPGKRPTAAFAASVSRREIPPCVIRLAARIKNGIAINVKELSALNSVSGICVSGIKV
jgi:hypothetical protein